MNKFFYDTNKICNFYSSRKIILGRNIIRNVGDEAKALGCSRAIIVTDPGLVTAGITKIVEDALHEKNIESYLYDKVEPEPPARVVDDCAKVIREEGHDIVIGLGGGSSLDVAKGVALMATNPGSILDHVGLEVVPKPGIPKILIPTTAGTGSEVTKSCVLTDEKENTKKVVASSFALAEVAILDPTITFSMPAAITANTGMDALVHAIESYVSVKTTPFAEILAMEAISLIAYNLPLAYAKGSDEIARYNMLLAANIAGQAFGSSGLGAVHGLAYVLGNEYHIPHGLGNAIMLPHVMDFNKTGNLPKFAKIAQAMGEDIEGLSLYEAAEKSVRAVRNLLEAVNIPYQLSHYGIPAEDLPKLVDGGMKQARLFVPNPRDMTEADVKGVYEKAL